MKQIFLLLIFSLVLVGLYAQNTQTQSIFIELKSKNNERAIPFAKFELLNFSPARIYTQQDSQGIFRIDNVPVGRQRLKVESENYQTYVESDIIVAAGMETFVSILLEEAVITLPQNGENKPEESSKWKNLQPLPVAGINNFSNVGTSNFSLDEVNRFSGSRSDIARLVTGQGGVVNCDDGRNDIIARGATPLGLQWRVEGIPVVNPSHFGYISTTAGYFPIININAMANSEFMLGNFSAEYGNSTSGVFDINLRSGNKEKTSLMAGVSLNGAELVLEGPMVRKNKGSFMIAGRYSIIKALAATKLIDFGTATLPTYGDLNFKFDFGKTKKREFSIFGYLGAAQIFYDHLILEDGDVAIADANKDQYSFTRNSLIGAKYKYFFNKKNYLQVSAGSVNAIEDNYADFYPIITGRPNEKYRGIFYNVYNGTGTVSAFINSQINRKYSTRNGFMVEYQHYHLYEMFNRYNLIPSNRHNFNGGTAMLEAFHQSRYRFNQNLTLNAGVHALHLLLNNTSAIDPRLSLQYDINNRHRISLGYAMQHQQLPQRIYFYRNMRIDTVSAGRVYDESARNLKMWGNHYLVLEYTWRMSEFWRFSASPYYRSWFNVPVRADLMDGYSLINNYSDLQDNMPLGSLKSTGTATNYGIDMSLQKSFSKGLFFILSGSYFKSTYSGSDGIVRNSRFNREWISRLRINKEFRIGRQRNNVFFVSSTITAAGGEQYTPINLEQSRNFQAQILTDEVNQQRTPYYFRADIKLGMRINSRRKRISHYFYLDIMNATGHQNPLRYQYSIEQDQVIPVYQLGVFPDFLYRIQF